jgi:RNA polymerase sigma-70 factor, ECF subfamily
LTDEAAPDPAEDAERADSLSMAFLLLLERLNPVERAVYLLHDVFDFSYDEIASIVDKTPTNCRQLALRARRHLQAERPRFEVDREEHDELAGHFFAAMASGDLDALVRLVAGDVTVYGDGGGKAPQWLHPISGADKVTRLLVNVGRTIKNLGLTIEQHQVNGHPGALVRTADGALVNVFALHISDGAVLTIRSVINPDKLRHLGPLADLQALTKSGET